MTDFEEFCDRIGYANRPEGQGGVQVPDVDTVVSAWKHTEQEVAELIELKSPRVAEEYHEDLGPVLWWRLPVSEPPRVGSPLDDDWVPDYYTHFTKLPEPFGAY